MCLALQEERLLRRRSAAVPGTEGHPEEAVYLREKTGFNRAAEHTPDYFRECIGLIGAATAWVGPVGAATALVTVLA